MTFLDKVFALLKKVESKTSLEKPIVVSNTLTEKPKSYEFDYVVFDLKTANVQLNSIFSIAIIAIKNDKILEKKHWYVRPNPFDINPVYYQSPYFSKQILEDAGSFAEIWEELNPYISNQKLVAHFIDFNIGALKSALNHANLPIPSFSTYCTYLNSKKTWVLPDFQLTTLAKHLHLTVKKGNVFKDAYLCANVFLKLKKAKDKLVFNNSINVQQSKCIKLGASPLLGKNIAVAGAFQYFKHYEIKEKIRALGGIYVKNITAKTDFFIAGETAANEVCPKKVDASTHKVKIINEEQFLALLASQNDFQ
ncbi:BRCT domain-containing protein [Arcicella rosea]|uniref:DNA polymerase-3 subunit epsilon n=1 Tax=Arcicella rosea TaxID=502909 RepID=A0A841F0J6_9BACT|nr:BRCT domain-containing protein [Arcicella rosea]MBB6005291.1 DNA polymerase-3 subunit epsilon [Arcicella rosea]